MFPFHISYSIEQAPQPDTIPVGSDGGIPYSLQNLSWNQVWTYRRALGFDNDWESVSPGEVSNQNLDNDYTLGYVFLSAEDAIIEARSRFGWKGGLNVTSLSGAEQRSFGWYHYLVDQSGPKAAYLSLNQTQAGTGHGLAKVPYLRDNKRIRSGLDGFKLYYSDLNFSNPEDGGATARHFEDTIGIGVYLYADVHALEGRSQCDQGYPDYITNSSHPVKPYYIPFRAIAPEDAANVLVPGKSMAQSFLANAATRLHPEEWVTGTAAGAAAVLMHQNRHIWKNGNADMYKNVKMLQEVLLSEAVKSPLEWTLP